ncbi:MAG: hypothetical protein LBH59_02645, partial [Planctomycetaceae bacterium]|nr:hypothetical protein [Planctomycetaceae bacterium]
MTLKEQIRAAINNFQHDDLTLCTLKLFDTLGYNTKRQCSLPQKNSQYFIKHPTKKDNFSLKKTIIKDWKSIDLVFQLTSKELMTNSQLHKSKKFDNKIIESYLFVAIELTQNNYSRSKIAQIAREINKTFPMPTLIIFRYENKITIAITNHQTNHQTNKQNKNNTEKITLIKDIEITNIHCAHLDILCDLSLPQIRQTKQVNNFADLNNAWMQIIDTKELNKHFYKELSNWYSWAIKHVNFPNNKNQNNENHNSINLIRLITRIIFVWFIKEKHLIPEKLFDPITLKTIVKNFNKNNNSTNYYNTILQNLFFVTLNQKTNEHNNCAENCNEIDAKMNYRYENLFIVKKTEIQELFKEIPFLNCGLFDCLDEKNIETNKYEYVDGFSNDVTKCALIPDFIFFGKEQRTDLNPIFETKNKKYANKGLFNILKSYKFTVAENTAIEEEIALDPELLGNVFENLLASYNPETKITTRKQTGSFYTPKEIVEYMVDESLIAYLKNYLSEHQTTTTKKQFELENKLRSLLSYETKNPFDKNETIIIIQAINNCNILDPACGSGAFPIGILHKLVLMLQKLDP